MRFTGILFRSSALALLLGMVPASSALRSIEPSPQVQYRGPLELTPSERRWLAEHRNIRLGVDPAWEPFEFFNANGKYSGMAAEYIELLNEMLGIDMQPVRGLSWQQVIDAARGGEIDVLPAVVDTPQRRSFLRFTHSYLNFPMVIMTRNEAPFITGIEDLYDSRVGVVKGYATIDLFKEEHPNVMLVEYETLDEGLENLSLGRVDAFVENLASIVSSIKRTGVANIKVAAPTTYRSGLSLGVRRDWPELVSILDKALSSLSPEQIDAIHDKWIRIKFERSVNLPFAWKVGMLAVGVGLLILAIIFIWNRRLVREVDRRTQAEGTLARRNQILERLSENHSLESVLEHLVRTVETEYPEMLASILLLDPEGRHFSTGIAPSLPEFYNKSLEGLAIGKGVGSCGHAAFTGALAIAEDIHDHPNWEPFRELALQTDLRACWSQPICAANGRVLGTFALYYTRSRTPSEFEVKLIEELSLQAAMAIEYHASAQSLRKLSLAVEQSPNAVLITARDGAIEYSNPRFSAITGYPANEVFGKTLRLLQPEETASSSRTALWSAIEEGREWTGEMQCRRKDGSLYWSRELVSPIVDIDGTVRHFVWQQEDVTETRESLEQIAYQATHDALTGLLNRHEFERQLRLARVQADDGVSEHILCFLDLDQFKIINDTVGHVAGDELLRQIGLLLKSRIRKQDCLARFGGDEFAILMEHCSASIAREKCEELRKAIENHRFSWEGRVFSIGACIGLASINAESGSPSDVLRHVDIACYAAKEAGRNRTHLFQADDALMQQRSGEMLWATRITRALENDGFALFAQKIVPLNGTASGPMYEVLLRMHDEDGSLLPPGAFLPAAERFNLITRIDRWVVDCLIRWLNNNQQRLPENATFAVNLSGASMGDTNLLEHLVANLNDGTVSSARIKFEITETAAIGNLGAARLFIESLRAYGVEFALDDFGSGLSSFGYLKNLDVDYIKIDGMFVRDMTTDPINAAMVRSINEIGHVMGKRTIAEFVENAQIRAALAQIGVDFGQGYGLGRPAPIDDVLTSNSNDDKAA